MKFEQVSYEEYKKRVKGYKKTIIAERVEEFIAMDIPVAEIKWKGDYSTAAVCAASFQNWINANKYGTVRVQKARDKVYIINLPLYEKLEEV